MKRSIVILLILALSLGSFTVAEAVDRTCSSCGRAVTGDADYRYCPYCGAALEAAEAVHTGETYTFRNPALEETAREALGKPGGPLYADELAELTQLTELDLNGNEITDISPLAALTSLKSVGHEDNPISDYSPVAHVFNVER